MKKTADKSFSNKFLIVSAAVLLVIIVALAATIIHLKSIRHSVVDSVFPAFDIDGLAAQADTVVKGRCTGVSEAFVVKPDNGGDESVFKNYYFTVDDTVFGYAGAGDVLSIRVEGGRAGRLDVKNADNEIILQNKNAVAYLEKISDSSGEYYIAAAGTEQSIFYEDENGEYKNTEPITQTVDNAALEALKS